MNSAMAEGVRRRIPELTSWNSNACRETVVVPAQPLTWSFPSIRGPHEPFPVGRCRILYCIPEPVSAVVYRWASLISSVYQLGNIPPISFPVFSSQGRFGSPINIKSSPPTPAVTWRYLLSILTTMWTTLTYQRIKFPPTGQVRHET